MDDDPWPIHCFDYCSCFWFGAHLSPVPQYWVLSICIPFTVVMLVFIAAINECDSSKATHNCEQICVDQIVNFTCACKDGYRLKADGINCTGRWGVMGDAFFFSPSHIRLHNSQLFSNLNCEFV